MSDVGFSLGDASGCRNSQPQSQQPRKAGSRPGVRRALQCVSLFLAPLSAGLIAAGAGGCTAAAHQDTARTVTLDSIAGTNWVLRAWNLHEAAPAQPEVTLASEDSKFVGTAGCNRYFAGVKPADQPGDLSIGPAGATRMMCPPEQMVVEDRFLKQLAGVERMELIATQLALTYDAGGTHGVMLFDPRPGGASVP